MGQDVRAFPMCFHSRIIEIDELKDVLDKAPENPWVTMANTVRQADEDQTQGCKENMDSLLTFVRATY